MFFNRPGFYANVFLATSFEWDSRQVCIKSRPYHSLSLRLAGGGEIVLNGKTYTVNTGDLIYLPANCGYTADYSATEMLVFHFNAEFKEPPKEIERFDCSEKVLALFKRAVDVYAQKKDGYTLLLTSIFYEILALLSTDYKKEDELLLRALSFISDRFFDPELKLSQICRFAGASEATLRRRFYERFSLSPIDYIIELRIDKACELIAAQGLSVAKAAEKTGFSDPKYLSRQMKKRRGFSPSSLKNGFV